MRSWPCHAFLKSANTGPMGTLLHGHAGWAVVALLPSGPSLRYGRNRSPECQAILLVEACRIIMATASSAGRFSTSPPPTGSATRRHKCSATKAGGAPIAAIRRRLDAPSGTDCMACPPTNPRSVHGLHTQLARGPLTYQRRGHHRGCLAGYRSRGHSTLTSSCVLRVPVVGQIAQPASTLLPMLATLRRPARVRTRRRRARRSTGLARRCSPRR